MISYRWVTSVPPDVAEDLATLVTEAADFDAEAGFSTADPQCAPALSATVWHLLVSMPPKGSRGQPDLDALPDVQVVAYLRLEVTDEVGVGSFVVRPDFRSLGVGTLLAERLLAEPDGWGAVDGLRRVRIWSHGTHPAAERMSWRFGATATREVYKTLRLVGGRKPYEPELVEGIARTSVSARNESDDHAVGLAPADRDMWSRWQVHLDVESHGVDVGRGIDGVFMAPGLIDPQWSGVPTRSELRALLDAALVEVQSTGARLAALYVDAADDVTLAVSREVGFVHDQTDRVYELSLS